MSYLSNAEIHQMMLMTNDELLAMGRQELLDLHAAIAANIAVAEAECAAQRAQMAQHEANLAQHEATIAALQAQLAQEEEDDEDE